MARRGRKRKKTSGKIRKGTCVCRRTGRGYRIKLCHLKNGKVRFRGWC